MYAIHETCIRPNFGENFIPPALKNDQLTHDHRLRERRLTLSDIMIPVFVALSNFSDNSLTFDVRGTSCFVSISLRDTYDVDFDSICLTVTNVQKHQKAML